MDRLAKEELCFSFTIEKDKLVELKDKIVARLHFIEGALFVLNNLEKETSNGRRPTETSGNREEVKGCSETTEKEAEFHP